MHSALAEFKQLEENVETFTYAMAVGPYRRYIGALEKISPPPELATGHHAILTASNAMLAFLIDAAAQNRVEPGARPVELEVRA